jgi:hypothetical protein
MFQFDIWKFWGYIQIIPVKNLTFKSKCFNANLSNKRIESRQPPHHTLVSQKIISAAKRFLHLILPILALFAFWLVFSFYYSNIFCLVWWIFCWFFLFERELWQGYYLDDGWWIIVALFEIVWKRRFRLDSWHVEIFRWSHFDDILMCSDPGWRTSILELLPGIFLGSRFSISRFQVSIYS